MLKKGDAIQNGDEQVLILSELGGGGQGTVYKVSVGGEEKALKWYASSYQGQRAFKENLKQNIEKGTPSPNSIWPEEFVENSDSYGYLMDIYPSEFRDFIHVLNKDPVGFASDMVRIDAALNLTAAFQALHRRGYSYQDLNDGNLRVNPQTGDVLICDNDNVTANNQNLGILGTGNYSRLN